MFLLIDILLYAVVAAIVVAVVSYSFLRWSREHYRFLVSSLTTFLGFTTWNIVQSNTGADRALNIDWPIFPLSWADVGSGVLAFVDIMNHLLLNCISLPVVRYASNLSRSWHRTGRLLLYRLPQMGLYLNIAKAECGKACLLVINLIISRASAWLPCYRVR